jgi:hypothetical protein
MTGLATARMSSPPDVSVSCASCMPQNFRQLFQLVVIAAGRVNLPDAFYDPRRRCVLTRHH